MSFLSIRSIPASVVVTALLLSVPAPDALAGACAPGTYGIFCEPCPGGQATPCSGHGICDDGIAGSGVCTCYIGYIGAACDQCPPDVYNYPACNASCVAATDCSGNGTCNASGDCDCNANVTGAACDACDVGYYGFPSCNTFCDAAITCSGNGVCNGGGTCNCDDGFGGSACENVVTVCAAQPLETCVGIPTGKSTFKIKNNIDDDTKDLLIWKWSQGGEVTQVDTDHPLNNATYSLCVYDTPLAASTLAFEVVVGPGSSWVSSDPKGWKYTDKTGAADGVTGILVKTGPAGKTKALVKAKGASLPLSAPVDVNEFFAQDTNVTVQLVNSDTTFCWTATYTGSTTNEPTGFTTTAP